MFLDNDINYEDDIQASVFAIKIALLEGFLNRSYTANSKRLSAYSDIPEHLVNKYELEMANAFNNFYILDIDLERLRLLMRRYSGKNHPLKLLSDDGGIFYEPHIVNVAHHAHMLHYYYLMIEVTRLKQQGYRLMYQHHPQVGLDAAVIAEIIQDGLARFAEALSENTVNYQLLTRSKNHASKVLDQSCIKVETNMYDVIIELLGFMHVFTPLPNTSVTLLDQHVKLEAQKKNNKGALG